MTKTCRGEDYNTKPVKADAGDEPGPVERGRNGRRIGCRGMGSARIWRTDGSHIEGAVEHCKLLATLARSDV